MGSVKVEVNGEEICDLPRIPILATYGHLPDSSRISSALAYQESIYIV